MLANRPIKSFVWQLLASYFDKQHCTKNTCQFLAYCLLTNSPLSCHHDLFVLCGNGSTFLQCEMLWVPHWPVDMCCNHGFAINSCPEVKYVLLTLDIKKFSLTTTIKSNKSNVINSKSVLWNKKGEDPWIRSIVQIVKVVLILSRHLWTLYS